MLGGPGAVLWMWFTGVFGIATKYAETLIAIKYRVKSEDGTMLGGAMYALDRGLKLRWLGIVFAIFAAACGLGIGCSVPANAVVATVRENFAHDEAAARRLTYITAAVLCILVGIVIIGGVKSITRVSEKLVPFMAAFYVIGCIIILIMNADVMGQTITTIVSAAFTAKAAGGGFVGSTLSAACRYVSREDCFPMNPAWALHHLWQLRHRQGIPKDRHLFP